MYLGYYFCCKEWLGRAIFQAIFRVCVHKKITDKDEVYIFPSIEIFKIE